MPMHKQVTTCLKSGGPVSKFCSCNHCTLGVCSVCGAYEGSLTTDCPGETVSFDRQKEVYETNLDYSDARGWHQGAERWPKETHFEAPVVAVTTAPAPAHALPAVDPRAANLQQDLVRKAVAWAIADRACEDRSAALAAIEDEASAQPNEHELATLERTRVEFHLADQHAQQCDDEFRQAARKLAAAKEVCDAWFAHVDVMLLRP